MWYNVFSLVFALGGLAVAYWLYQELFKQQPVNSKMQVIATAIKEGANAFLRRQYRTIGYLAIVAMFLIYLVYAGIGEWRYGLQAASAFLLGAVFSSLAGIAGMYLSVRVNLLTAESAENSFAKALKIALRGGAVSGILVVSLSLLGISSLVWFYNSVMGYDLTLIPGIIIGFGFGASFVALFAQLGGGIFTKAADMGADLVGKVETGIPEDDARNPAVIADLVGDNVGDCAGRGADLFESTAAENIGAMILGVALYPVFGIKGIMFPLVIRALGLLASIIGIMSVRAKEEESPMKALNRGYYVTAILSVIFLAIATKYMLDNWYFFWAGVVGVVTSIFFVFVTQYYTEYRFRPVRSIAKASETGPATNIVTGLAVGMESTALPVMGIVFALLGAYKLGVMSGVEGGGLYGTAVATMGMLASCAYILAMDNLGPIVDNAGGIAEMSG
ncbi:MAG: sodium/proton-translocating pyrophosphatase, partial [Candidatus Buchananbacteria bacterium]